MGIPVIIDSKEIFALAVKPREAFLEWARYIPPFFPELSLEELCEDPNVYLFSGCKTRDECLEHFEKCYRIIFENELRSWHDDAELWPKNLSREMFEQWFDIQTFSAVHRICCISDVNKKQGIH